MNFVKISGAYSSIASNKDWCVVCQFVLRIGNCIFETHMKPLVVGLDFMTILLAEKMVWSGDEEPPFLHDHPFLGPMVKFTYAVAVQPAIWFRKNVVEPNRTSEPEVWYHR